MPITRFPDPRKSSPDGIVAVGGDLHPDSLLLAYSQGIFPWPIEDLPLTWFCPPERAVVDLAEVHIPRSLARTRRQAPFRYSIDEDFRGVITACADLREDEGTWITPEMLEAYVRLHELGHAHSVEVWEGPELVGGVYGVDAGGAFAGESMFHLRPNASKLALLFLFDHLRARGAEWVDIQVMTPHMKALGAKLISRDEFLDRLRRARARGLRLF